MRLPAGSTPNPPNTKTSGFTLVETVVVMAIIGLLFAFVFAGQGEIQARARFNAAVDQSVENINYARTEAVSNVNPPGNGKDAKTVQLGISIEFGNDHFGKGYPLEELSPIYAFVGADGEPDYTNLYEMPFYGSAECNSADHPVDNDECWEQFLHLGDNLVTANPDPLGVPMDLVFIGYVHTATGLIVCHEEGPGYTGFTDACNNAGTPMQFNLVDQADSNLKATIQVDPETGFAKRLN